MQAQPGPAVIVAALRQAGWLRRSVAVAGPKVFPAGPGALQVVVGNWRAMPGFVRLLVSPRDCQRLTYCRVNERRGCRRVDRRDTTAPDWKRSVKRTRACVRHLQSGQ